MKIYVTNFAKYQPSPENPAEQPKLEYVDALFRRRLSQVTRMTIETVHALGDEVRKLKLVFGSFRGEIARQLKINKGLVEDADVMPAQFSLSVFNTPPAAATIALGMKAGYTAVYPDEGNFHSALVSAAASVLCGAEKEVVFAWADEKIPEEYRNCAGYTEEIPFAFACIISSEKTKNCVEIEINDKMSDGAFRTPQGFAEFIQNQKEIC